MLVESFTMETQREYLAAKFGSGYNIGKVLHAINEADEDDAILDDDGEAMDMNELAGYFTEVA